MKRTLGLLAVLASLSVFGQESAQNFSLKEAQEYALKNSYSVKDKQLEVEKAKKVITQSLALSLPRLNASYGTNWNIQLQPQAIPGDAPFSGIPPGTPNIPEFVFFAFGAEYITSYSVGADWNLAYANVLAGRASAIFKKTKSLDLEDAEMTIMNDVAKAYYTVMVAEENVRLLDENYKSLKKNLDETKELYKNGFADEQTVDQLELLVSNLENNLNNAKRQEELAYMILKFNMGMDVNTEMGIEQKVDRSESMGDNQEILGANQFNPKQHIEYQKTETLHEAAVISVRNERSQWVPALNIGYNHLGNHFSNDLDPFNFNSYWAPGSVLSVGLKWNISPVARPAIIQEKKLDVERAEVAKKLTENQLTLEYEQAKSNYVYALDNYNNQKENVEISKRIRDKERIKYAEGMSSSLDLTQIENQYLQTQQNYMQALLNLMTSKEDLEQALGNRQ